MRIKQYKDWLIKEADESESETESEDEFGLDTDADTDAESDESEDKPFNDAPEVYIESAIQKIKVKIENLFEDEEVSDIGADEYGDIDKSKQNKKNKESMTLKDMGATLESSDIIKSSKTHKSLVVKFSDTESYYSLYIKLSLKEAIDLIEKGEELTDESIQKAYVKMKKISLNDYTEIGTVNRNVMVADIDESFIIELKLELDGVTSDSDGDNEEFKIET